MALYEHVPHPHIAARKRRGPAKVDDHRLRGHGRTARFNAWFGLKITVFVGTMWCAYVFAVIALVSLPSALRSGNTIIIVSWVAQTFLQLVLLSIILVGQNIQAAAADQRSEDTYKDAEAVLHEAIEIQKHLAAQDVVLERLIADIAKKT